MRYFYSFIGVTVGMTLSVPARFIHSAKQASHCPEIDPQVDTRLRKSSNLGVSVVHALHCPEVWK